MNKNEDEFNGITVKLQDGTKIGELQTFNPTHRDKAIQKVCKLNYGTPLIHTIMRDLIYLDKLRSANTQLFLNHHPRLRRAYMEKYGVQIDPKKVEEEKKKQVPGEKTANVDDPKVNVPKHPDKGTEPFEKEEDE
jgi:hypothetical protein